MMAQPSNTDVRWVATLSNGDTAVEHSGEYQIIPGERKPWVRLTQFLVENDLYLTALKLDFGGRTIHMPRTNFDRFGLGEVSRAPSFYSLQYLAEGELTDTGELTQSDFIDLISHYDSLEVHHIQDLKDEHSWIVVTEGSETLAPTPSVVE